MATRAFDDVPLVALKENPAIECPTEGAWTQIVVEIVQLILRVELLRYT
ncbi:MAG TPA: hypothetical protein VHN10_02155 [Candidatus Acidoferrales bacterium]|nr:hypothetical protein [Candidatus Acidoferrales bacterium]